MDDKEKIQNVLRLIEENEQISEKRMHEILEKSDPTAQGSSDCEELILLEFRFREEIKEILED
jgi:Ca2+-binding EF-hand superfamily protein